MPKFSNQVERLIALRYPDLFGINAQNSAQLFQPLACCSVPTEVPITPDLQRGTASFVLVINLPLAPVTRTLPLVERRGKPAVERLYPIAPERFRPIEAVELPLGEAYLLLDIDRGRYTFNVTPDAALESIIGQGRSPLTIEEGIAVLTHSPEFLQPNNCFLLLASRCGDKRVPALWLSKGQPKLGWCWAGNPHTWLGSASCSKLVQRSRSADLCSHNITSLKEVARKAAKNAKNHKLGGEVFCAFVLRCQLYGFCSGFTT